MKRILFLLLTIPAQAHHNFLCGDNFRLIANHIFDERRRTMAPEKVKARDIVFVKTDYLQKFFAFYHRRIKHPYILITHNSDDAVPGKFVAYLEDPKIIAWFGQNVERDHPKLIPIPIGIYNELWEPQCAPSIMEAQQHISKDPSKLLYMNMTLSTNNAVRAHVYHLFVKQPFCYAAGKKLFRKYLKEMSDYCFVLSPEGNGIDCHRTWEALYMGCIPVVKSHSLNALYQDLPVLIVNNWDEVNADFLKEQYNVIQQRSYVVEKLYMEYWYRRINEVKYRSS